MTSKAAPAILASILLLTGATSRSAPAANGPSRQASCRKFVQGFYDWYVRLDEKHRGDGTPAPGNPSSGVWRLVESIEGS